jgi:hypothetical protein
MPIDYESREIASKKDASGSLKALMLAYYISGAIAVGVAAEMLSIIVTDRDYVLWIPVVFFAVGGIALVVAAFLIQRRRGLWFSKVVAILFILAFPIGTIIGIYSLVVFSGRDVRLVYEDRRMRGGK